MHIYAQIELVLEWFGGCSMKVRYGSYGGGILPKLYDKINTDLATKVRGPLCVPKSSKAEEDTDEEIKSQTL